MKELAKKFPKAWREIQEGLFKVTGIRWDNNPGGLFSISMPDCFIFGYLVLEYFPKHGIEIERFSIRYDAIIYSINVKKSNIVRRKFLTTPEEAISKAFEIREKQLDGK